MLLVLSDYECPGCRVVHSQITAKRLKEKMEVKFIDAPLKRHPLSMEVAVKVSSLELSKQEEVRAKLMTNPKLLQNFAKQTKDSIIGKAAIEKNLKIFNEIGCKATPTILFYSHNQKEWTEIQHLSQLESRF
jgi:protein-disulfide isomerase